MFPLQGVFQAVPCPERTNCNRQNCIFSHRPGVTDASAIRVAADVPRDVLPSSGPAALAASSSSQPSHKQAAPAHNSVPFKRPVNSQLIAQNNGGHTGNGGITPEPPRKLQRTGPASRPVAVPTAQSTPSGVPIIQARAAESQVAIPVRQTMLKNLYDHFVVLYEKILPANPTLAAEHALRQEEEVYRKSTKTTYRHAVIMSIAALKNRVVPTSISHPSIGTEGEIAARVEAEKKLQALRLTPEQLEPYILSVEKMTQWGYVVDVPAGPGGDKPSEEGSVKTCERCGQPFKVKRREGAEECVYHWGKPYSRKTNGERARLYTCCSRAVDSEGCERGLHVFYESSPEDLHSRHPFSFTRGTSSPSIVDLTEDEDSTPGASETSLDIVALDCEMIYTTGGMRVARVSVVDSMGKEIFDELIRMDDGVEVIDFNTRFSGITAEAYAARAALPLVAIRRSLDTLISARTIVIGHALENDLKTLRMVHHRCVDTAVMFPHPAGPPYRKALRTLTKEHLGRTIQAGGGTVGHNSVEDSVATLDLVRWHVLNGPKPQSTVPHTSPG